MKKITAEKARLIKAGKIKKHKPLPLISEDEKPFSLPEGWEWERVGNVCKKVTDGSHNPPPNAGSGYPMLSSQNVNYEKIDFSSPSRFVTEEDFLIENQRTNVKPNDVLLNIVASIGRSAVVPSNAPKFVLQRSVAVLNSNLVPNYFSKMLVSPLCLNYYDIHAKGTAQKGIYLGKLSLMPLAIPPLAEQHRIVAKVDQLMTLCDQLEQQSEASISAHQTLVETLLTALTQASSHDDFQATWQHITQHFDTLFTTQHSVDQLKQCILQLAVMGKLVPQDPNDEPASELLKKIAAEKAKLIKAGKIKKQKLLPPIGDEEKPFDLPEGWEYTKLQIISSVGTGATPARDNSSYYIPAEHNWVTSGETSQSYIYETKEKISSTAIAETNVTIFPPGTLVIAMYGQGKTRGQITELKIAAGTNQACAAIRLFETSDYHRKYIKLFFQKAYEDIRELAEGGAQPNLNVGKVSNTIIPIPPLAEQHRIVAKVDQLMALCDQLQARLAENQTTQLHLTDAIAESAIRPQ